MLRDIGVYADANVLRGLSVIKAGTQVQVLCWTTGQRIANLDVWDRIKWGAGTAYVHDRWVDMGGRFPRDIGIPAC